MREVILVGATWCAGCKAAKPFVEEICTKLGYVFKYEDFESSIIAQDIVKKNCFRSLPVLAYINSEEDEAVVRYKVAGFDYKGIQSFLLDEDDLNLREEDIKNMNEGEG